MSTWFCYFCDFYLPGLNQFRSHCDEEHPGYLDGITLVDLPEGFVYCLEKDAKSQDSNFVYLSKDILVELKSCTINIDRSDADRYIDGRDSVYKYIKREFSRVHFCPKCHSKFDSDESFKQHSASCGIVLAEKFSCEYCWSNFGDSESLIKHLKLCLSIPDKFSCDDCGKVFRKKMKLNIHRTTGKCSVTLANFLAEKAQGLANAQKSLIARTPKKKYLVPLPGSKAKTLSSKANSKYLSKSGADVSKIVKKAKTKTTKTKKLPMISPVLIGAIPNTRSNYTQLLDGLPDRTARKTPTPPKMHLENSLQSSIDSGFQSLLSAVKNSTLSKKSPKNGMKKSFLRSSFLSEDMGLQSEPNIKAEAGSAENDHYLLPDALGNLLCSVCYNSFPDVTKLKAHVIKAKHNDLQHKRVKLILNANGKKVYQCKTCNEKFKTLQTSYVHAFFHDYPPGTLDEFKCMFKGCPSSFKTLDQLKTHIKIIGHSREFGFACNECGKDHKTRMGLQKHINNVDIHGGSDSQQQKKEKTKPSEEKGVCLALNEKNCCTAHANTLNPMIQVEQDGIVLDHDEWCMRNRACLLCLDISKGRDDLDYHYKNSHRSTMDGYRCKLCDEHTFSYVQFAKHVREGHKEFYIPDMPEYGVTQIATSQKFGLQPTHFTCENCRTSFPSFSWLRLHRLVATDITCKLCENSMFCKESDLSRHVRQNHPGVPNLEDLRFRCHQCKKMWTNSAKFLKHMAQHFTDCFDCCFCSDYCLSHSELDKHLFDRHFSHLMSKYALSSFSCESQNCQFLCGSLPELVEHTYRAHFSDDDIWVCPNPMCLKVSRSLRDSVEHVCSPDMGDFQPDLHLMISEAPPLEKRTKLENGHFAPYQSQGNPSLDNNFEASAAAAQIADEEEDDEILCISDFNR